MTIAIDARPETRIALDRLSPDPLNVRKTYRPEAIAELAASIKAVGLLKNLVVRKAKKRGHFYVSAGGRRLAALTMLAEAGDLTADYAVRAIECSAAEAVEISLAENVTAEAMNPVDEFEAYNALVSDRVPVAEIAARFGKTDAYVRQRMALARVSPRILDAYRGGEIDFDIVAAFTARTNETPLLIRTNGQSTNSCGFEVRGGCDAQWPRSDGGFRHLAGRGPDVIAGEVDMLPAQR